MKAVKPTNRAGHESILFRVTMMRPDRNMLDEPSVSVGGVRSILFRHIVEYAPVSSCCHVLGKVTLVSSVASLGSLVLLDIVTELEREA